VRLRSTLALALVLLAPVRSFGDAVLLVGEPYGRFGSFNPTGHAAVYLTRVCADSPARLRRCQPGETGAVISRYHRIGGFDWVAVPLIPYLYAVDHAADAPAAANKEIVLALRDTYRRARLRELIPDGPDGSAPRGDWIQLVGAAYDRQILGFSVTTSADQDDELIAALNGKANKSRFNLLFRNCADFARDVINFYYPKALRSNFLADVGFTTPKQLAKSLVRHSETRPELQLTAFAIPQIPGSRRDSRRTRGVLESLVKTKKYAIPLSVAQPWIPVGLTAGYLLNGRFDPQRYVMASYEPVDIEDMARRSQPQ
jgi:hypothetical protein